MEKQGSVVGEEAPWQHIGIHERHEVEREVDLMVLMVGWESNFARLAICNWRLETVLHLVELLVFVANIVGFLLTILLCQSWLLDKLARTL